ncbi:MAG: DNA methyltransferase [Terracidiphilus sp.]
MTYSAETIQTTFSGHSQRPISVCEVVPENNRVKAEDRAIHDWYRFVLSFPPHLVRDYVQRFGLSEGSCVLDPFCGTGTTLVECKRLGINSVGLEVNPMPWFATNTKIDWTPHPSALLRHAEKVAGVAEENLFNCGIPDFEDLPLFPGDIGISALRRLPAETGKLILTNSISPLPLHKTLVLLETLEKHSDERFAAHEKLALAKAIVSDISNLHFGPEVGVGKPKKDAAVVTSWFRRVTAMAHDLSDLADNSCGQATVYRADSRNSSSVLAPNSVDAVITSPPYPNEKDYTRTTRLESVLLGFTKSKADLRLVKHDLVRSNTRSVYKSDTDHLLVKDHSEIQRIAEAIEDRRIELNKTSGFERLYSRLTTLYFGGMHRHLADLRDVLKPGAQLAYVVGDQASYLRVMIRTGQLLADIAESLGYEVTGIDLFRTRLATATGEQLREEVVLLRWPGAGKKGR